MTKRNFEQDKIRIIAVDTSTDLARRLTDLLGKDKVDVYRESRLDRVLERFESEPYDVLVVTSAAFDAGKVDGIELLEVIAAKSPMTQVLFLVAPRDIGTAMSALKVGTYQYAKLPIGDEELELLITTTKSYSISAGTIDNRIKEGRSGSWRGFREWSWFSAPLKLSPRRSAIADDPFPSARSSELCTASPAIGI